MGWVDQIIYWQFQYNNFQRQHSLVFLKLIQKYISFRTISAYNKPFSINEV